MNSFNYYNPTNIIFGKDSVGKLAENINGKYKKVLLHYGGGSIKASGLYDEVKKILEQLPIEIFELGGVKPNPKLSLVYEGISIVKQNNIDFVLAVGGGSVIDSAKAICAGAKTDKDVWDLFTGAEILTGALPLGVILTIPATGSESSPATVITNEVGLLKRGLEDDRLRPEFAILNPLLTLTLPKEQTFAGVIDIISHVLERYFSKTKNVDLTESLCEATLRSVIKNAYILLDNPSDYDARAEIMLSGTIAHSGLLGVGREEDWASHRIGHELSALYGTTHGNTLSIIFPAWMKYVQDEDLDIFRKFAVNVFGVEDQKDSKETGRRGIEKFEAFIKQLGMPLKLSDENIPNDSFELMADKATGGLHLGRFKKLYKDDVVKIYNLAQ